MSEYSYAAKTFLPSHAHDRAAFCSALRGGYKERYQATDFDCGGDSVVFRPANDGHSDHFGEATAHCFVVEVPAEWLIRAQEFCGPLRHPISWRSPRLALLLRQIYQEYRNEDAIAFLAAEGLLWQLLAETSRENRCDRGSRRLEMIRELLHTQFANPPGLVELADLAGVHPTHLCRAFHKRLGCTISQYVRRCRIEFVWRQLAETEDPIVDIAIRSGFAHQAHLTTVFRSETGKTPAEVRRLRQPVKLKC